jgi:hypothetical protein
MVTIIKKGANKLVISQLLGRLRSKKRIDAKKYCGIIKIKGNPLTIQQSLRNEWV